MIKRYTIIDSELYSGMITDDEEGEWVKREDYDSLNKVYIELNSMFREAITDRDYWMKQARKEGILY